MTVLEYKKKHPRIYDLLLKRSKEFKPSDPITEASVRSETTVSNCFTWEHTPEGQVFWNELYMSRTDTFYEKYPISIDNFSII